jgi:hypothetical protein
MMSSAPSRGRLVLLVVLVSAAACGKKVVRTLVPPSQVRTLDSRSPFLKAHRADGGVYVLSSWRVDSAGAAIVGRGTLFDANRARLDSGEFRIPPDSVVLFETNVEEHSGAFAALTVMTGITAVVAGICAASPKTCFGSCPTIYAPDQDGEMKLQAEAFSSSIAPALEATDVDMLLHTRPAGRDYTLRITNEAFETHVIRHADVLAVPRPPGGRVYMASDGVFRQARDHIAPSRCLAPEGDCRAAMADADGKEWWSTADSVDLATREIVDLEFDTVPGGDVGLVLTSRQTLLTTYLIYQGLAYMGSQAGRWLAGLSTGGEEVRRQAGAIGRVLGNVEVLAPAEDGSWHVVGSVGETGPIAADTRVVPLPPVQAGPIRLRLRMTKGLWRLDEAVLVSLADQVAPARLLPTSVTRGRRPDADALRALRDPERALVTFPGDAYEVTYRLPEHPDRYELFVEGRGYYLEWMRREWMAEENPLLAARLVLDPAGALKALAPAYKKVEPQIEHLFWNSRYVR